MFVDSLTKATGAPQHATAGPGLADASKVVAKGLGLSKAYAGQKSSFTVDCSKAGVQPGPPWPPRGHGTASPGPPAFSTLRKGLAGSSSWLERPLPLRQGGRRGGGLGAVSSRGP